MISKSWKTGSAGLARSVAQEWLGKAVSSSLKPINPHKKELVNKSRLTWYSGFGVVGASSRCALRSARGHVSKTKFGRLRCCGFVPAVASPIFNGSADGQLLWSPVLLLDRVPHDFQRSLQPGDRQIKMSKQAIESRAHAYTRLTNEIRSFVNHSVGAAKAVLEAKRLEIWKEKWSTWQEYCDKEFGQTRQRVHQLLEVAGAIEEIQNVNPVDAESGKNKGILNKMTFRQAKELKGLPPEQKAEVFNKAVAVSGGKSPRPETIAKVRRSSFDPDSTPRDNSNAYLSGHVSGNGDFHMDMERDEIDPADKISKSTQGDVVAARQISLERTEVLLEYPKLFSFEVLCQEEEVQFSLLAEKILVKRGKKKPSKIDLHAAIRGVCSAYKRVTGKTLAVKPMDAGQLRRLLDSGITLEEFISVGEKAWDSTGFLAAGQSHQLASFVKHYGNIRNEVQEGKEVCVARSFKQIERDENRSRLEAAAEAKDKRILNRMIADAESFRRKYGDG